MQQPEPENKHHSQTHGLAKPKPWAKLLAAGTFMFFLLKGLGWIALFVAGYFGVVELSYLWQQPGAPGDAPQLS